MKIKFKDVKRFCRFKYAGKVWTRTKGRYARPAGEVEDCKGEWPIDLETEVETVDDTQESMKARAIVNRLLDSQEHDTAVSTEVQRLLQRAADWDRNALRAKNQKDRDYCEAKASAFRRAAEDLKSSP